MPPSPCSAGPARQPGGGRSSAAAATAAVLFTASPAHAIGDAAPLDINKFHPAHGSSRIPTGGSGLRSDRTLQLVPQLPTTPADRSYTLGIPKGGSGSEPADHGPVDPLALWRPPADRLALPVTLYQNGQLPEDGFLPPMDRTRTACRRTSRGRAGGSAGCSSKGRVLEPPASCGGAGGGVGIVGDLTFPPATPTATSAQKLPTGAAALGPRT